MFDSLFFFRVEALQLLARVFAWLSDVFAVELLLVVLFCGGFLIFRASHVQRLLSSFISPPGKHCDEGSKLSMATPSTSQKDTSADLDVSETGPRLRCPRICAQAAGQLPDIPGTCSTVVLKNIPTRHTPERLLADLHEGGYFGMIDFFYVPIDFKKRDRNLGFAIMNFSSTEVCVKFAAEFHLANSCDKLPDAKIQRCLEVSPALLQGSRENIRHLQKSSVLAWLAPYPAWLPQVLDGGGLATPLKTIRSSNSNCSGSTSTRRRGLTSKSATS